MIIAGQLFKSAHIRRVLPAAFPAVEVSSYDQLMAFIGSSVREDRRMRFGKRFNITESDNINFLSQSDKLLLIMEDGIGIFELAGSVYFRVITVYADPGLFAVCRCKSGVCGIIPLHGRTSVVPGVYLDNTQGI